MLTDNMEQFVINYDMKVYKCTARDFTEKYCVGKITEEGKFVPNELYYKYYIASSPFICNKHYYYTVAKNVPVYKLYLTVYIEINS